MEIEIGIYFLVIVAMFLYNYFFKHYYKRVAEMNRRMLARQEKYCKRVLENNKETIRFRHDFYKHINCMYMLFEKKQYKELKEYFENIGASLSELSPQVKTGNSMINAIVSDCLAKYPDVTCEIRGGVSKELRLSRMDICTIFSNLLENAFTAAAKSVNKTVWIDLRINHKELCCEIKNTVQHKIDVGKGKIPTDKVDKVHHGHGIYNVEQAIKKNDGSIWFTCDEKVFRVEFIINNSILE